MLLCQIIHIPLLKAVCHSPKSPLPRRCNLTDIHLVCKALKRLRLFIIIIIVGMILIYLMISFISALRNVRQVASGSQQYYYEVGSFTKATWVLEIAFYIHRLDLSSPDKISCLDMTVMWEFRSQTWVCFDQGMTLILIFTDFRTMQSWTRGHTFLHADGKQYCLLGLRVTISINSLFISQWLGSGAANNL
jgi:hypothetical protein